MHIPHPDYALKPVIEELTQGSTAIMEATFPSQCTPPKAERLEVVGASATRMAEAVLSHPDILECEHVLPRALVPFGIFATREASEGLVSDSRVDPVIAESVSIELAATCQMVHGLFPVTQWTGGDIGAYAELGMLNMVWQGIVDGELNLDYAFLLGSRGLEKVHGEAKGDIDMVVHASPPANSKKKSKRHDLQVKASNKKAGYAYRKGIKVVAAQGLFDRCSTDRAVSKLIRWQDMEGVTRKKVYRNFGEILSHS